MTAVVFERVPVAELPERWCAKLTQAGDALVTVRVEEEAQSAPAERFSTGLVDTDVLIWHRRGPRPGCFRSRQPSRDVPPSGRSHLP